MVDKEWPDGRGREPDDRDERPAPGEQPIRDDVPPMDDAPVPGLTEPSDTQGG
jgi:hypothetical protein